MNEWNTLVNPKPDNERAMIFSLLPLEVLTGFPACESLSSLQSNPCGWRMSVGGTSWSSGLGVYYILLLTLTVLTWLCRYLERYSSLVVCSGACVQVFRCCCRLPVEGTRTQMNFGGLHISTSVPNYQPGIKDSSVIALVQTLFRCQALQVISSATCLPMIWNLESF